MIVMMGVSGAGKSAVGAALATKLDVPFREGDMLHPAENVARMRAGVALSDADRAPWLDSVAGWMAANPDGVVTCSALKRAYRDRLRCAAPEAAFVLLDVSETMLAARLAHRPAHFMPAALLASQLATLERPDADERAITVAATDDLHATVALVLAALRA